MKKSQLRQIIKEEVSKARIEHLQNEILEIDKKSVLHENVITSIMNLFLEPKFKKKAEALKNSGEYKELEKQIKVSSEALEQLTNRLKRKIDEYDSLISDLQQSGIDVKVGDPMDKIIQKTKQKHKDILKKYKIY